MVQCGIAVLFCVLEFSMDDIFDRVMNYYVIEPVQNIQRHNEVKAKLRKYLATLSSAGQRDADQLIEYGVAYLRGLHEGPDSRYTGCRNFKFERRFHNIKKAADIGFAAIRRKSKAAFVAVGA